MDEIELKPKTRKEKRLPADAAGHIMVIKIPAVLPGSIVQDIWDLLSENEFDTINYIYVVDKENVLKGVVSIKEIFHLKPDTLVSKAMKPDPISVSIYANKEHVALTAVNNSIKAVPVVDTEDKLLGVVTSDDILNILHREHLEDILYSAGISPSQDKGFNLMQASTKVHILKRLPWLVVGLFGGMLAAFVVDFFESAIRTELALAAFIPAVVYMADAVGSQSQTIFIRSLALDHRLNLKKYVIREIKVNVVLAVVLGVGFFFAVLAWSTSLLVSSIMGISVLLTIIMAMAVAMLLPWVMEKKNYDPAIASGPFATVVRDLLSLLIYFSIASVMLLIFS